MSYYDPSSVIVYTDGQYWWTGEQRSATDAYSVRFESSASAVVQPQELAKKKS